MKPAPAPGTTQSQLPACVEHGVWTPIPTPPPKSASGYRLKLRDVALAESKLIKRRGVMTFHAVGCSAAFGQPVPGKRTAEAMTAQINRPRVFGGTTNAVPASFLYHLGDIVYKADDKTNVSGNDQASMFNQQFFAQYSGYERKIFAIAGNHDSKSSNHPGKSAIEHFVLNFCAAKPATSPDNATDTRKPMIQPYPYWVLETPVARIVGLHTNDINGGQLDDPMSDEEQQYQWLLHELERIKKKGDLKALIIALHYPPFSGTSSFKERGDPNLGPTPRPSVPLRPLGVILHEAFRETGLYPDIVISAHAHLYQRLTYSAKSGRRIPYLIAGSGGHGPVEKMFKLCSDRSGRSRRPPFDAVFPSGLHLPKGDRVQVAAYNDTDFGFIRLTVDLGKRRLLGEFFAAFRENEAKSRPPRLVDSFRLDLKHHTLE